MLLGPSSSPKENLGQFTAGLAGVAMREKLEQILQKLVRITTQVLLAIPYICTVTVWRKRIATVQQKGNRTTRAFTNMVINNSQTQQLLNL